MIWRDVRRDILDNADTAREYEALAMEHDLARSIIQRRLEKGLSQRQLAARAATKQPVISRLESGNARPSLSLLARVAKALDASVVVRLESHETASTRRAGARAPAPRARAAKPRVAPARKQATS